MKKVAFVLLICISSFTVFAQKVDTVKRRIGSVQFLSTNDIMDNIGQYDKLGTFMLLVGKAKLTDTLKITNPITVFVPEDESFHGAMAYTQDSVIFSLPRQQLADLVLNHAVAGKITSKDLLTQIKAGSGTATLTTLSGHKILATINGARNIVLTDESGNKSIISKFDIAAKNGILDIIDGILIPKSTP